MRPLVSVDWLLENLERVVVLDGTFFLPDSGKDAEAGFASVRIKGARRWNINKIAMPSDLPHMMPSAEDFAAAAGERGIDRETPVVVYDQSGIFSSPRVWFTFRHFGHKNVAVLDGGLPAWQARNLPVDTGVSATTRPSAYAVPDPDSAFATVSQNQVLEHLERGSATVLDARPVNRFKGQAPEPRPGLKSGHMPGSVSLPSGLFVKDGFFLAEPEIRDLFDQLAITDVAPLITSCGSGVTAATLTLALHLAGRTSSLYDGSWAEWGDPDLGLPVNTI